jgi:hypothetical protein
VETNIGNFGVVAGVRKDFRRRNPKGFRRIGTRKGAGHWHRGPEEEDHNHSAHYAPKDKVTEAMVMGTPVTALCGKTWVPSRSPEKFPVCPECKEIWESLPKGEDGE